MKKSKLSNEPAFPSENKAMVRNGLTKREYFIGCALMGYSSRSSNGINVANLAIKTADEIIKLLEKEE